jgi:hypothetical protein
MSEEQHEQETIESPSLELPTAPENVDIVGPSAAEAAFPTMEEERTIAADTAAEQKFAGKYDNVEQLVSAYEEAQRKITELSQETSRLEQQNSPEMHADRDIKDVLTATGLDMVDVRATWEQNHTLTQEQYEAFGKVGYSKDVVDTFITGQYAVAHEQTAIQDRMKDHAGEMAGGKEELGVIMDWAAKNYNEIDTTNLNQRLSDPRTYESAIKELLFDHSASIGASRSKPLAGSSTQAPAPGVEGFNTTQEVLDAFTTMRSMGITEEMKARLAKTPHHLLEGVE